MINLSLPEVHTLMSALQFLSLKDQNKIEKCEKVRIAALYNKLVSYSNDVYVSSTVVSE